MLWVALHLPLLSLESFEATLLRNDQPAEEIGNKTVVKMFGKPEDKSGSEFKRKEASLPTALMDAHSITSANQAARALGVKPGLKRATALALAPQLILGQADLTRDAQALTAVAHAALAFTPYVVIQPPSEATAMGDLAHGAAHTVLLEVQSSLRYFGGLQGLLQRLRSALTPLGHRMHTVSAATPLGAALLARVHANLHCADIATTRSALNTAPVWLLGPGREHWDALQGMGLRTIADLHSVPRDGLARRFGEVVLSELDRAMGHRPDPRLAITLPPTFSNRLELFARADTTEQLMHASGLLLARLVAWLSAQHAFVRRFNLRMHHEKRSRRKIESDLALADGVDRNVTRLEIALAEPSRDHSHLLTLLRERLSQLQLPAPTLEVSIHADDIARSTPPNSELFPTLKSEQEGLTRLIERLQARLGTEQVLRLVTLKDHRPERATAWRAADARMRPSRARSGSSNTGKDIAPLHVACTSSTADALRPTWLLHEPLPLREKQGNPLIEGQAVQLLSGPERIESGWWDSALTERDYFIAKLPDGALVWIYRARMPVEGKAEGWFLQGRFG
jgi:protein ImuB